MSFSLAAQHSKNLRGRPPKLVSDADKTVVVDIFKPVNPGYYYLEFSQTEKVYGTESILTSAQWNAVLTVKTFSGSNNFIIGNYNNFGLLYVVSKSAGADLEAVLGKEEATRLKAIINKYMRGN